VSGICDHELDKNDDHIVRWLDRRVDRRFEGIKLKRAWEADPAAGVGIAPDERLVVIPRNMIIAAKPDIPDA
ncbi:MAG: hypothetical protein JWL97_4493, partial [Gemmatimonadales bacterium]|nr:hypothetical protein [Gemmatimonadales bacterium]